MKQELYDELKLLVNEYPEKDVFDAMKLIIAERTLVDLKKKEIPIISEKASERKDCPYCDTGKLHQHIVLIDNGFVNYLLSLGDFKEDDEIYECPHCKEMLSEEIMGKKCPKCKKWTYIDDCKRKKTLSDNAIWKGHYKFQEKETDIIYREEDAKQSIKNYIQAIKDCPEVDLDELAKEIFGDGWI